MVDKYLKSEIFSNESALESFTEMRAAQPPKDRLHYFDIVLEGTTVSNAHLIQKLYTDIISKSNIDFGSIPDSHGNILKYKEYKLMQESIGNINTLFKGKVSDEVTLMNSMHDMIVSCKKDYELGFTYNIEIIKVIYNISVMTLFELINICILSYTKSMRKDAGIKMDFGKIKKKDIITIQNAKSLLKSYRNGQWKTMIDTVKKDKTVLNLKATEADALNIGAMLVGVKDFVLASTPLKVIAAIIIIFVIIRKLIYYFYVSSIKVKDYVETQKTFVDATINSEREDGTPENVIKKHISIADKLRDIANFIEVKILHTNKKANEEIAKSNTTNFHTPNLDPSNASFGGGDISF